MKEHAAAPAPEDTIKIGDNNHNDEWAHGQDEDDNNILLPRPARLQGCENDPEEESLFFNESDNDNDDNNPDENYSQSSDGADKKKKSKRKTPTSTIRTPRKSHFSGRISPAEREAADILVAIGAEPNFAKFMVMDRLDRITEIQELARETIALYARNIRKNTPRSDIVSTRFILDLKKAALKMTHIKHCVSCYN